MGHEVMSKLKFHVIPVLEWKMMVKRKTFATGTALAGIETIGDE
jgi:hypothetical protein